MNKPHLIYRLSIQNTLRDVLLYVIVLVMAILLCTCTDDTHTDIYGSSTIIPEARVDAAVTSVEGTDISGNILPYIPSAQELAFTLTRTEGTYTHTWTHLADYPADEPLMPGTYTAELSYGSEYTEGVDAPYFYGSETVYLNAEGEAKRINITARLANTLWKVSYTDAFTSYFKNAHTILHSAGGGYIKVLPQETRPVFLRAGTIKVMLVLEMPSGESVEFLAASVPQARPAYMYNLTVDMTMGPDGTTPQVVFSFDESIATDDVTVALTPEFINSQAPMLQCEGFRPGTTISVAEGTLPAAPVQLIIDPAATSQLLLSTKSPALIAAGWPAEIDLVEADASRLQILKNLGLTISDRPTDGMRIYDFSQVIANMRADGDTDMLNTLSILATSHHGRMTGPVELNVRVTPVDMAIVSVSPVVIGINKAQMQIVSADADPASNLKILIRQTANDAWMPTTISSVTEDTDTPGRWYVTFDVPEAGNSSAEMRLLYCDNIKAQYTLQRVAPDYSLEVDSYAMLALVKIDAGSAELTATITSMANIYIDGQPVIQVSRQPRLGYIIVGGLEPNRSYRLTSTMYDRTAAASHPDAFTQPITFITENSAPVPNGDFEEIHSGDIKYTNLPQGGRYSQNIVELYNRQNYTSYKLSTPKRWANTNAKTFCMAASNHNTWYMVPSVFTTTDMASGAYAVVIRSTAYDIAGPIIPDYRQTAQPYTEYSQNIPGIANKAAGKLFLGSYTFDPATSTESYVEGVEFHSRPSALNGYYRLNPALNDVSDPGLARVEIIGNVNGTGIVIARGEYRFEPAVSYKAFSIPLTYEIYGIKAQKIKIVFASSSRIGSIAEETANIATYPNPAVSMSIGNELWIDNLTFTY